MARERDWQLYTERLAKNVAPLPDELASERVLAVHHDDEGNPDGRIYQVATFDDPVIQPTGSVQRVGRGPAACPLPPCTASKSVTSRPGSGTRPAPVGRALGALLPVPIW